jgi:hypothetical protein
VSRRFRGICGIGGKVVPLQPLQDREWSRSTMDSIRVSEALDSGSIPDETTTISDKPLIIRGFCFGE